MDRVKEGLDAATGEGGTLDQLKAAIGKFAGCAAF